jgi:DNA polymerase-3 subunit delta'
MFKHLIGNQHVQHTLKLLLTHNRLPNSLLFAGDEGIGKRQFALAAARAVVCVKRDDEIPCGVCSACVRAGKFNIPEPTDKNKDSFKKIFLSDHVDVATVVPYKNFILVDAIRDLEREANFNPYEAPARFFIIDEADKMNDAAASALLKTLEEPPPTSFIFLVTSRPDSLLPTIRSRCQTLRFAPIPDDEIERYLIDSCAFSHDEARLASRLSRGSIGRAVSIDVAKFRLVRGRMLDVLRHAIETGDRAALLRASEEMNEAKNKELFEENLDVLESLIHDVWTLRSGSEPERIVNADLLDELTALSENAGCADLHMWLSEIETMRQNFIVNINRKIAADALFISMAGA